MLPFPLAVLWALGVDGGVALQGDQYVAGPKLAARLEDAKFLEVELGLLAGLGPDHFTFRSSLRLRPRLDVEGFRVSPIFGVSLYRYDPRGEFEKFCDKADLDCGATTLGLEAGLGVGWRWLAVDFVFATGEVPLYTFTAGVRFPL